MGCGENRPKDGSSTVGCENTITHNEPSEATAKLGDITTHNALAGAVGRAWQYGCFRRGLRWGFPSLQTVAWWDDVPPTSFTYRLIRWGLSILGLSALDTSYRRHFSSYSYVLMSINSKHSTFTTPQRHVATFNTEKNYPEDAIF